MRDGREAISLSALVSCLLRSDANSPCSRMMAVWVQFAPAPPVDARHKSAPQLKFFHQLDLAAGLLQGSLEVRFSKNLF